MVIVKCQYLPYSPQTWSPHNPAIVQQQYGPHQEYGFTSNQHHYAYPEQEEYHFLSQKHDTNLLLPEKNSWQHFLAGGWLTSRQGGGLLAFLPINPVAALIGVSKNKR